MNLSSVFTDALKKGHWPIYHTNRDKLFCVGDYFTVSGDESSSISQVSLFSNEGSKKLTLSPIKGSLRTEVEEGRSLSIYFKYQYEDVVKVFFMRFHFFELDPAVFTFQDSIFDKEKDCEKCCCFPSIYLIAMSYGGLDETDYGGGGHP